MALRKWAYTKRDKGMRSHCIVIEKIKFDTKAVVYSLFIDGLWIGLFPDHAMAKQRAFKVIK